MEHKNLQMVVNTKANILMERQEVQELIYGPIVNDMMGNG